MKIVKKIDKSFLILISVAVFISLIIILIGFVYFITQKKYLIEFAKTDLKQTAAAKEEDINNWYKERYGDCKIIQNSDYMFNLELKIINDPADSISKINLKKRFNDFIKYYGYQDIIFTDISGKTVLSSKNDTMRISPEIKDIIDRSLKMEEIVFTDFYKCSLHNEKHLDFIIPILRQNSESKRIVGSVILRINPDEYIYPVLLNCLQNNMNEEILIARIIGDSLLFVNNLKGNDNSAFEMKVPLSEMNLSGMKSDSGCLDIIEWKDYKEVVVYADIRKLKSTSWLMITKIDKNRVLESMQGKIRETVFCALTGILFVWIGILFLYFQTIRRNLKDREKHDEEIENKNKELIDKNYELSKSEEELQLTEEELRVQLSEIEEKNLIIMKEKRFSETVIQRMPTLFVAISNDFKILKINKKMSDLTGFDEDELVGKNYFDIFIINKELDSVKKVFDRVLKDNESTFNENSIAGKDGVHHLIEWYGEKVSDTVNRSAYIIGIGIDITERRNIENALNESTRKEKYFGEILENSVQPFGVGYPDGGIGVVNTAFCNLTGYSEEELKKINWNEVLTPKEWISIEMEKLAELYSKGLPVRYEKEYIRKDGTRVPVELLVHLVKDDKNIPKYYYSFVTDLSEKKRLENEIFQIKKMESIGQLVGGIAHDFNNVLAGIMGSSELIASKSDIDPDTKRLSENIISAAQHAANLTSQLLSFARKGKFQNIPIDAKKIVGEVVDLLRSTVDKKISVNIDYRTEDSFIMGDPSQIESAVLNVGLNARDAIKSAGEIKFCISEIFLSKEYIGSHNYMINSGKYIVISIKDNGVGMTDEVKKHLFEPFFTTKKFGKGTGLGMASVFGTIKNHNGLIDIVSEVGMGTTVEIYLPKIESPVFYDACESDNNIITIGTGTVMIVDDEEGVLTLACDSMTKSGYKAVAFSKVNDAIKYYEQNHKTVDLVIIDIIMPEMNGIELFKKLKTFNPSIKAVLTSGYGMDENSENLMKNGIVAYIQKPYRVKDLILKIQQLLKY